MATNYPNGIDTTEDLKNDSENQTITSIRHPTAHNNVSDALIAIETELGVHPSGPYVDVVTRLNSLVYKTPTGHQVIVSQGSSVVPLILRVGADQTTARLFEVTSSSGSTLGFWDRLGVLNGSSLRLNNVALASTHLADSADILRNPSPSITSPTMSTPTLTGTPTAPTAAVDTNTTQVATTAFVRNQGYIPLDSPALTGTPTAPTPPVGDSSTRIATTAYVISEISARQQSPAPVGTIVGYGNSTPPSGWLICNGSAVSRTTYSDLFGVIGTTYGAGDGSTTFNLPDLRGRIPWGLGTHADVDARNDNDGVALASRRPHHSHTHSLSLPSVANHTHTISGTNSTGSHSHSGTGVSSSSTTASGGASTAISGSVTTSTTGNHSHSMSSSASGNHSHSLTVSIGSTGGAVDTVPYAVAYYIIRAVV